MSLLRLIGIESGNVLPPEEDKPKAQTDLFDWLGACWGKKCPEGTPPTFMMHRFLASERDFAPFARTLQDEVRDPRLVFGIWKALLPQDQSPPRLQYVWPKKAAKEEELIGRMQKVLSESRLTCERMLSIVRLAGREKDLYAEFGVELPKVVTTKR